MAIFTMLIRLIHEHGKYFHHLLIFYSVLSFKDFKLFETYFQFPLFFFSIFLPFIDMHYVNLWMKITGMCQCMVGHLLMKSKKWSFYLPIFCYKSVWSFMPLLFWIKMVFFNEENTRAISENEVALWFLFGIEVLEMIFIVNY